MISNRVGMLKNCRLLIPCLLPVLMSCEYERWIQTPTGGAGAGGDRGYSGSYPRFPHDVGARKLRDILVFYSPDDIFASINWQSLGYPEDGFFKIHNAFPKLKVTMQTVPENRYLGDIPNRNIERDPVAAQVWRDLAMKPEFRSWLEFGNHGYYHSPEGDPDLDHHEFDGRVNPAAHDSAFCYGTFTKARNTYAAIGLDNERIIVMRFPGSAHTPMALRALADHGFLAYFESLRTGREQYVHLGEGRGILAIPTVQLDELFATRELVQGLRDGGIDASSLEASPAYRAAMDGAMAVLDGLVRDGGVINLFDHWWEHSREEINGVEYRFALFRDILAALDRKYGTRIWWGFGSELALWSHMQRNTPVTVAGDDRGVTVAFGQPAAWKAGWTLTAGYSIATRAAAGFPALARISYTLESEGHARTHILPPDTYWVDGNVLHFNFPYSGALEIRIAFGGNDPY